MHDFEKDAILKRGTNTAEADKEKDRDNECGIIWLLLSVCGNQQNNKESTEYLASSESSSSEFKKTNAYFRGAAFYQITKTDVSSFHIDLEAVRKSFGFRTKFSKFSEINPNDDLNYLQFHGLYKPQTTQDFDVAIGVGVGTLRGEHNTSGFSVYIPVYYKFNSSFSLEANSSITRLNENPIIDSRISIGTHYKQVSLLLSYLLLISPEENIHGPSLGISIQIGK